MHNPPRELCGHQDAPLISKNCALSALASALRFTAVVFVPTFLTLSLPTWTCPESISLIASVCHQSLFLYLTLTPLWPHPALASPCPCPSLSPLVTDHLGPSGTYHL